MTERDNGRRYHRSADSALTAGGFFGCRWVRAGLLMLKRSRARSRGRMIGIDLFAGAGGFTEGAHMAGVHVAYAANHWPLAVSFHQANHPGRAPTARTCSSRLAASAARHDVQLASPACQGPRPPAVRSALPRRAAQHGVGGGEPAPSTTAARRLSWKRPGLP